MIRVAVVLLLALSLVALWYDESNHIIISGDDAVPMLAPEHRAVASAYPLTSGTVMVSSTTGTTSNVICSTASPSNVAVWTTQTSGGSL